MRKLVPLYSMLCLLLLMGGWVQADLVLVDDFESYDVNTILNGQTSSGSMGGLWDVNDESDYHAERAGKVIDDNGNQVIAMESRNKAARILAVDGLADPISEGEKGILFFRFYYGPNGANDSLVFRAGLHALTGDDPFTLANTNDLSLFNAGIFISKAATNQFKISAIGGTDTLVTGLNRYQWYNIWMIVDNGSDTFDLYVSEADSSAVDIDMPDGEPIAAAIPFSTATTADLTGGVWRNGENNAARGSIVWIDQVGWRGDGGLTVKTAHSPEPANGMIQVPREQVLSWSAPDDPNVTEVVSYTVYMDPNQANVAAGLASTIVSSSQTETSYTPTNLLTYDMTYYWRVDVENKMGNDTTTTTFNGKVWSFTVVSQEAVVAENPSDLLLNIGESGDMTAIYESDTEIHYKWYHSMDNSVATSEDDIQVGVDSSTLTLEAVDIADEGYYYCVGTNSAGSKASETARLGIRRLVANWTLDQADYVNEQYQDISGEGHHADPNGVPDFIAGQHNDAVAFSSDANGPLNGSWADAGTWNPSEFSDQLTVSFWMNWTGPNGTYQTVIGKRLGGYNSDTMVWQIATGNNDTNLRLQSKSGMITAAGGLTGKEGQWIHVIATYNGSSSQIYIDGVQKASGTGFTLDQGVDAPLMIGRHGDGEYFNGALDNVKIFNYGMDAYQVADLYYQESGNPTCLAATRPTYDLNQDCVVNLQDFVLLTDSWLECGWVPTCVQP